MAANINTVLHGRRKGSLMECGDSELLTDNPSQAAVLPVSEWLRMKEKFSSWQDPAPSVAVQVQRRRQSLHQKSKAIVSNWENTIEGQRLKRLQARQIREEEEEKKRVQVDEEEALFQAEVRKKAIEQARVLLYYQTDRVKEINGAVVLSEVLRERDAQVLHKKKRQDLLKSLEDLFLKSSEKAREMATLKDMIAAEERSKHRTALSQFHLTQSAEKTEEKLKERLADLEEQKKLEEEAAEYLLKKSELNGANVLKQAHLRQELDAAMEKKKLAEATDKQLSQAEDERIKMYTGTKRKMEMLHKKKEVEDNKAFQCHQQRMCNHLQKQMESVSSDEDQRIAHAVQQQITKRDAIQQAKQAEFVAAARDINKHMFEQMKELEQRKKDQEQMDQEMLKQKVVQDQKFHNQQFEKQRKVQQESAELQQFQLSQIAEMEARKEEEKEQDLAYDYRNQILSKVEETQFQQYAKKVISEAKERGAPLKPLISASKKGAGIVIRSPTLELHEASPHNAINVAGGGHGPLIAATSVRPSYQAVDADALELPSYSKDGIIKSKTNTQKRLGFIW